MSRRRMDFMHSVSSSTMACRWWPAKSYMPSQRVCPQPSICQHQLSIRIVTSRSCQI
ncbi:hypothetical protein FOTG_18746 [Fusarium oxysporum f. sp. vasinfectum 25433]|uniref:Uncharacterized protein n=1 Tax=Fusarium oxysporum f. sp. vasinfectum 25433 TaxID=1089449 RepID=X0LWA9_FUSOX|nr:hypothetical protein FOTG_18746 [Fusarium oxysporum f. sp. vasinfectum 25433]